MLFYKNIIFPFVGNTIYLLEMYARNADSDDEIVTMVVGGGAVFVVSFNEMDSHDSHDINNTDDDDNNSFQSLRRKLFQSTRHQVNYEWAKQAITMTT